MDAMWFYDDPPVEFKSFRQEALALEKPTSRPGCPSGIPRRPLRADPDNEDLKTRLAELKKHLKELDRQAPWISSAADMPMELALWGVPNG